MFDSKPSNNKRYSFFYKIYRRIRYIRYLKRLKKQKRKEAKLSEKTNRLELQKILEKQAVNVEFKEKVKINKSSPDFQNDNTDYDVKEEVSEDLLKVLKQVSEQQRREEEKQHIEAKERQKRIVKYLVKRKTRQFFNALFSLNIKTLNKLFISFKEARSKRQEFFTIFLNSTACFIFAYFLLFFVTQFFSAIAASFFDYETIIKFNNNFHLVKSDEWFSDSVKTIYSAGPITALLMAVISSIIFSRIKEHTSKVKIFFLWFSLHGYTLFFGGLLIGTLFSKGFGHVVIWSYIMDTGKLVYSMVSIFFLVLVGFFLTRPFLISANSYFNSLNSQNRSRFINGQIVLPFIIGNIIMMIFWLPEFNQYFQLVSFSMILSLFPILFRYKSFREMYFEEEEIKVKLDYPIIITAILFVIICRIIFGIGIRIA